MRMLNWKDFDITSGNIFLMWSISFIIDIIWKILEILFDGGVQESISDTIIGFAFVITLYVLIKAFRIMKGDSDR